MSKTLNTAANHLQIVSTRTCEGSPHHLDQLSIPGRSGAFSIALWHDSPRILPSIPSKGKKMLITRVDRTLKAALQRSVTEKTFLSLGIHDTKVWGSGTTECRGITIALIDVRSWTNFQPLPFGFLTGKMGVLQRLVQGTMSPFLM